MKKKLITIDEKNQERIENLKEMILETIGGKWSTSEIIRYAIFKSWKSETKQGKEYGEKK